MRIARTLQEVVREDNSVVTVGSFDGVHIAHAEIVREVLHRAKRREGRSVVITFDPHPRDVLDPSNPVKLLTTSEEREDRLAELGVDVLFVVNFTFEFSRLTPKQFFRQYVVEGVGVSEVIVGYDHMFGRDREAGIEELVRFGKEFDFSVFASHPYTVNGKVVSSTLVRTAMETGDVEVARTFLGYPYRFKALVIRGDGRGKSIGYPTANLEVTPERKMLPGKGVYLVGVVYDGIEYFGMMNIGTRPTINEEKKLIAEVHLFDFHHDIYGSALTITMLRRLRDEQKFDSLESLVGQLHLDREHSLKLVKEFERTEAK